MRISNDTSDILHASDSTNSSNNNTPVNCEEDMLESKKNCRGEGWSKQPAAALVDSWKHLQKKTETFNQPSVWIKVKKLVGKHGQPKSLRQIKNKLRNFKDYFKQAKDIDVQQSHFTAFTITSLMKFSELGML